MRLGHFLDPRRKNLLIHFEVRWGSRSHHGQIGTVESLSTDRVESLAQHDIAQSAGEQWWLFLPLGHDLFDGGREWIFVNYRKQRMYVHPNASESLAWKGRDIYDLRTWASLGSLDEIRDFDSNR
jgi:hypothetical protein